MHDYAAATKRLLDREKEKGKNDKDKPVDVRARDDALSRLLGHINIIAGACMGLGLRYAGSGNQDALKVLRAQVRHTHTHWLCLCSLLKP